MEHMKHNATRFLSLLLALVMVIGLMPVGHVHAEEEIFHVIGDQVTNVEANGTYVICIAGTKNALSNQQGSGAWSTHTLATGACDKIADARILWTLESAEGGYKLKNESGYLNISRNTASLNETGHIFELVYHEGAGWAIKSLETNEYGNNLGDSGSIGGWSGDGTKFDLYTVNQATAEEVDPFGKLRGFWSKVSVDTETSYDWKEGLFEYAFDSNPATIWHSNWQGASDKLTGENTFAGVIDFGAVYTINQFSFTPRQGNNSGQVTQASLYVKETEEAEWVLVAEHATFAADQSKKDMDFEAQAVRYVKFVAEQSSDGWVAVSEFDVAYNAPAAHEHSYEAVITAPTCTEGGYTTYTCACGDTYVADETKALGHNDGPIVVENEKPSTCTEGGYYDAVCYCTVCGVETYRSHIVVGPDNHFPTVFPGYPATCTEPGLTDGKRCGVCLEWIEPQEEIPALGHKYEAVVTAPTCTEGGYTTYTCACGDSYIADEVPATGHNYHSYESVAPTCTEPGEMTYTCLICRDTYTEEIPTIDHAEVYVAEVPATCTEPGLTAGMQCEVCGTWTVPQEEIPATGHSYGSYLGQAATCTEPGFIVYYCAYCGDTYTEEIPAQGHSYNYKYTKYPTCSEPGVKTYTCYYCGDSYTEEIPTEPHSVVYVPAVPATCTKPGLTDGQQCCVCLVWVVPQEEIPALGHEYYTYVEANPTCTEPGLIVNDCLRCNHSYTEEIPAKGHSYESVVTAPTYEADGYTTYTCTVCGHSYVEVDEGSMLKYAASIDDTMYATLADAFAAVRNGDIITMQADVVLDATLNVVNDGKYMLDMNGYNITYLDGTAIYVNNANTILSIEADISHYSTITAQTAIHAADGEVSIYRGRYHGTVNTLYVSANGNIRISNGYFSAEGPDNCVLKMSDDVMYTTQLYVCGGTFIGYDPSAFVSSDSCCYESNGNWIVKNKGHNYGEWIVTEEPTCTEVGKKSRTCETCGHTAIEYIPLLSHSYEAVVTEPTCTEGGYTTYTCASCGDSYTADVVPANGHNHMRTITPPTCTEDGYTTWTCIECGDSYITEVVPANGHSFGEWTETKAPTCTEDGEQTRTCATCGETETQAIEKNGHDHEYTVTEPTCTEGGYTTYTCVVCGDSYVSDETEALGHNYENGSCVNCGEAEPIQVTVIAEGWSGYTTWKLTSDGVLTFVPSGEKLENGETNLKNYWKVDGVLSLPWGEYAELITKVVISEGIHDIGQMAFYELPNLVEVQLPSTIVEIRGYAFKNCAKLTTINLENVDFIREGAFYGCAALENVNFLTGVVIEDWAFSKTPVVLP